MPHHFIFPLLFTLYSSLITVQQLLIRLTDYSPGNESKPLPEEYLLYFSRLRCAGGGVTHPSCEELWATANYADFGGRPAS